jgi:hypothetical protein
MFVPTETFVSSCDTNVSLLSKSNKKVLQVATYSMFVAILATYDNCLGGLAYHVNQNHVGIAESCFTSMPVRSTPVVPCLHSSEEKDVV